jgi:hypothetical protein
MSGNTVALQAVCVLTIEKKLASKMERLEKKVISKVDKIL